MKIMKKNLGILLHIFTSFMTLKYSISCKFSLKSENMQTNYPTEYG